MKITDRISEVDLRPSDIVKLQRESESKEVSLSQATGWIKAPTATKAIEQLLWRLCDEKVEQGLSFDRPGRKKEVVAEIFQPKKVTGQYGKHKVEFVPATVEMATGAMLRMDEFGQMDSAPSPLVAPEFTDDELEAVIPINGPAKSAKKSIKSNKMENPHLKGVVIFDAPVTGSVVDVIKKGMDMPPSKTNYIFGIDPISLPNSMTYPLQSTGLPSWGLDRTYKIIGSMLKLNYNGLAYKLLNVGKLDKKGEFVIEGVSHDVSGFTEV
jgi:hypothetical protein